MYGDDNMLTGGTGVGFSAETAKMSQDAITAILKGEEGPSTDVIMNRLPNQARLKSGAVVGFEEWHSGALKAQCESEILQKL